MKPERMELVLLRSVGGPSRRYRQENLALLARGRHRLEADGVCFCARQRLAFSARGAGG